MRNLMPHRTLEWCLSPVYESTHIPNLLYEIYKSRPDLQKAFPDPFGIHQIRLLQWAQTYLAQEYFIGDDLPSRFQMIKNASLFSKSNSFFQWALAPVRHNTYIPNLLYEIYKNRPDLQKAFPDALRRNQMGLLKWAQYNLANEYYEEDDFFSRFNIIKSEDYLSKQDNTRVSRYLKKGINLVGYARLEVGLGESCRLAARAIQSANIPFGIINYPLPFPSMDLSWEHKEIKRPLYNVNIFHMNPDLFPAVHKELGDAFFHGRYNIGYWHWELPDIPEEWSSSFKLVDEIWVPSSFVLDSVSKKTNLPVICIPHCIQVECPNDIDRQYFGFPTDRFLFLSMYDIRSVSERKNPVASIKAFQEAFSKDDPSVGLVLKVNGAQNNLKEIRQIQNLIGDSNNIYLINQTLSRGEINALIQSVDCVISLHRSEGFGLVLTEAMYLEKPVIGTNWSGNTDFMDSENSCPVNYNLVNVGKDYGPYKPYQIWAEPDIEHAIYYMRKLVSDSLWRDTIAAKGKEVIHKSFSTKVVGQMIRERLAKLNLI
ncbi:glycosyltransferase family 4 protein [Bacillus pseudomycoides]|uniref:glycosyltransferase family 4 protein n=1 Tax=Bacillus pseudomycoides TaxID=64104 RepID=UPI0023DACE40|nr:glycosyltransferase family 4 protein [Bacillus pseudomycoides]MDF2082844.1 glycosyltransferase family 4 protein [Bacillus pseudomycoides]